MGHTGLGSGEITINLAFSLSSESSSGGGVQQPYWEIKIYSTKSINEHQKRAQLRPKGFVGRGITEELNLEGWKNLLGKGEGRGHSRVQRLEK